MCLGPNLANIYFDIISCPFQSMQLLFPLIIRTYACPVSFLGKGLEEACSE